jgi:hypothetical protein
LTVRRLWCAGHAVEVDESICTLATPRVFVEAFAAEASLETQLVVRRVKRIENGLHLNTPLGHCEVSLTGSQLKVAIDDGVFQAELALRLAYHLLTQRLGGVLVHGAALALGENALLATGKSGDGKSTLSRLCRGAGFTLLTDEVSQLFPDGTVCGTPFRSDEDNVGNPRRARVRYVLALEKAAAESMKPLAATQAVQLLMSQRFQVPEFPYANGEDRRWILEFLGQARVATLAFRKHEEVGGFVKQLISSSTDKHPFEED